MILTAIYMVSIWRVELWLLPQAEQRFASLDALKEQMGLDLEATVQFFEERKKPQNEIETVYLQKGLDMVK